MKLIKFLHKWLSLLVALQVLIWLGSGLFFNLMDHNKARGNTYRAQVDNNIAILPASLLAPKTVLQQQDKPVNSLKLISLLSQPYYLLNHKESLYPHFYNQHSLINAFTGEVKIIDNVFVQALAKATYSGNGEIKSVEKLMPPIADFLKEKNQLWQVNFADELNTSVYFDVGSGRLIGHCNDDKRFVDFFFMLHFMDYGSLGGFNHWQTIFFALITLLFSMTGFIWTMELLKNGRYKIR